MNKERVSFNQITVNAQTQLVDRIWRIDIRKNPELKNTVDNLSFKYAVIDMRRLREEQRKRDKNG